MLKLNKTKCAYCDLPGEHKGYVWRVLRDTKCKLDFNKLKKLNQNYCLSHYMRNMHGLYAYVCTAKCLKARQKKSEVVLRPGKDQAVWLDISCFMGPMPKCPWCSKKLGVADPSLFVKKATPKKKKV